MSDFMAGFASRLDAAARALQLEYSQADAGFAPADLKLRASGKAGRKANPPQDPAAFSPQPIGPRHYAPADPDANPTEGWDPLNPSDQTVPFHQFTDPVSAAHAQGYAEGLAAGREQGDADRERDQALLRSLGEALKSSERVDRDHIAGRLRQTVMFLVSKMVGDTGVEPDLLARRIDAATDMIADSAESAVLRVNPDDLPLLDGLLPVTLHPIGDPAVARGSFILESASTIVEDGPELWLEQLAQAIDRVGVPPLC